jgi:hypothetical protein
MHNTKSNSSDDENQADFDKLLKRFSSIKHRCGASARPGRLSAEGGKERRPGSEALQ